MKHLLFKSIAISASSLLILAVFFTMSEPQISKAVDSQFTVSQTVTSEIVFKTPASNVVMSGSLAGITGGTANGNMSVAVQTNAYAGYTMTIKSSSTPAMQGPKGGTIPDYTPALSGVPDFAFTAPAAGTGEFGYTVDAASTTDLAQKFLDNGTTCNTGALDTNGSSTCWYFLSTTATTTVVRSTATPITGATTTFYFRTQISPNSNITQDTYTATSTLTATANS